MESIKEILDRDCLGKKGGKCDKAMMFFNTSADPGKGEVYIKCFCWLCHENDDLSKELEEIRPKGAVLIDAIPNGR